MRDPFLAAAVQMCAGSDRRANLERVETLVTRAATRGARLVVLPEVFAWRGPRGQERTEAEPIPGPTTELLSALSRRYDLYLVGGSILEIGEDAARPYNTCVAFDPTGGIIGRYRKIHLFDVDIPNQVTVRESDTRAGGSDTVVVPTELGQLGLALCYDLRFPELFRRLVLAGAEILCLPAAFTFPTGAAHWEVLVRARAIENLCYVVAANQFGRSPSGIVDYGSSLVVDPWGVALARAGWEETVIVAEVDLGRLRRLRRELPCLEHARLL